MANFNFNKVIIGGRLTHDPELKTTASGVSVCSFTIAINRPVKEGAESKADFIDCVAWRQTAEFITRYFRRASSICILGSLQQRTWEDREGKKRSALEVYVSEANFVDSRSEMPAAKESPAAAPQTYIPDAYLKPREATAAPVYEDITDQEELPF